MKKTLTIIHILTLILGIIFRVTNIGWFLIILFIPEVIYRVCYFIFLQLFINSSDFNKSFNLIMYIVSISSYLLMSLFAIEMADTGGAYTMLRIIINPPPFITFIYVFSLVLNLILLVSLITIAVTRFWIQWQLKRNTAKSI